jgi:hypothetical protein
MKKLVLLGAAVAAMLSGCESQPPPAKDLLVLDALEQEREPRCFRNNNAVMHYTFRTIQSGEAWIKKKKHAITLEGIIVLDGFADKRYRVVYTCKPTQGQAK